MSASSSICRRMKMYIVHPTCSTRAPEIDFATNRCGVDEKKQSNVEQNLHQHWKKFSLSPYSSEINTDKQSTRERIWRLERINQIVGVIHHKNNEKNFSWKSMKSQTC